MAWLLLIFGVLGFLYSINALFPRKGSPLVFAWSFLSSWLTLELVWHHLVVGTAVTAFLVSRGALDHPAGVVGLVLMVGTGIVLVSIGLTTRRTVVSMRGALEELDPGPDAPRFPRAHVVFPFLVNHRRGVHRQRNVAFHRVAGKTLRLDVTLPSAPVPAGRSRRPALMQIHGGGWVIGDKREQGLPLLNHMAAQGWVGFNVNYRLSPGATFPDHLVDLKRALVWIKEHADEYGIDPTFVCVTGGSAGGHLTALMGLTVGDPRFQPGFEEADTSVAAAVPFYGIYDFTPHGAFGADREIYTRFLEPMVMKAFVDEEPERYELASPIHHLHADAPPFLVVHGDHDTLAPVADARTFVERLRAVSNQLVAYAEMKGAQHAFEVFPSARTAKVIEGVERFLSTLWERRPDTAGEAKAAEAELADSLTE
jgi:acetyl esterase/lipase